jgi:Fe-Mn family superoxide dismutase
MHYSNYLTYTNNLNNAIAGTEYENQSIENILSKLDLNNSDLRNNAGGYYNHSYWKSMAPNTGGKPIDTLAAAISKILVRMKTLSLLLKVKQLNSLVLLGLAGR